MPSKKPASAKAKAPAPKADEFNGVVEGSSVRFLGYADNTPDEERFLTEGEVYTVHALQPSDAENAASIVVAYDNPDFKKGKKPDPETNPKQIEVEVFPDEVELLEDEEEAEEAELVEEEEGEEAEEEEAEEEEEAPAPKSSKSSKAKAKEEPAKPAGKGKTKAATKPAPKAKEEPEEEEAEVLEDEDEEVLELIQNNEGNLIGLAQELESTNAANEYRLGGILFHIKQSKEYLEVEGGEEYAEAGGYQKFIKDFFNVDYRKAQYLEEIYVSFNKAGIPNGAEIVGRLGWTKAQKIAKPLLAYEDSIDEIIETAEKNTVEDLSAILKESFTVGDGSAPAKGDKKTRVTLKFRYTEEEAATVTEVIDSVAESMGCEPQEALLQILGDYAVANNVNVSTAKASKSKAKAASADDAQAKGKATTPAKPAAKAQGAKPAAKAAPAAKAPAKPAAKATAAPDRKAATKAAKK